MQRLLPSFNVRPYCRFEDKDETTFVLFIHHRFLINFGTRSLQYLCRLGTSCVDCYIHPTQHTHTVTHTAVKHGAHVQFPPKLSFKAFKPKVKTVMITEKFQNVESGDGPGNKIEPCEEYKKYISHFLE